MSSYPNSHSYGPESPSSRLPSRPRFQWDTRTPPWTDGIGIQEGYLKSVKLWKEFHDALPDSNSNKIPLQLQGIILKSQLFGRAQDLVSSIGYEDIRKPDWALTIARPVHKVDALSQVNNMSQQFFKLLDTVRSEKEDMTGFESRFQAQICRFHEAAGSSVLPESLLALMLMKNARVENQQRVSVLAPIAPSASGQLVSKIFSQLFSMKRLNQFSVRSMNRIQKSITTC